MGILKFFSSNNGSAGVHGPIKYYNLVDWWFSALSEDERNRVIQIYRPMGSTTSIIEGEITSTTSNHLQFLWCLAGWFNNKNDRAIAIKILDKAKEFLGSSPVLDVHFYYSQMVDIYYPERDKMPDALKTAIKACIDQINMAPQAAQAFYREYPNQKLPAHRGYEQLAIIKEKQKDYTGVVKICEQASSQGWCGNWQDRIERNKIRITKEKNK